MDSEIWAFMVHLGWNCWADHTVDPWTRTWNRFHDSNVSALEAFELGKGA